MTTIAERNTAALRTLLHSWEYVANVQRGRPQTDASTYAAAAFKQELEAISKAVVGDRNEQLNKSSFALGTLIGAGVLHVEEVMAALQAAGLAAGLEEGEVRSTVRSGLNSGILKPRDLSGLNGKPTATASIPDPIDTSKRLIDLASEIPPRIVAWLWPGVIPLGKLTTFAGIGGLGKTFVLCDITARVTRGAEWPFSSGLRAPLGRVLFISGEDDPDDTLVPRLIEMGADLTRVAFLKSAVRDRFTLADLPVLRAALAQTGEGVSLLVIDPPTAYLGGVDDHKNAELRGLLNPLANLVGQLRIAGLFNTHVNKNAGKVEAMMRVMGSVAWVNAVRAAHLFVKDEAKPERRFFLPMKMNNAKERKGLAYTITPSNLLARVEWLEEVDVTANEAIGNGQQKEGSRKLRGQVASEWLVACFREQLEWESDALIARGHREGISRNAIFEAKKFLQLSARRIGGNKYIWWVPPDWPPLVPTPEVRDAGTPEGFELF